MATANVPPDPPRTTPRPRRRWPSVLGWVALLIVLALGAAWAVYGKTVSDFAVTGTSYGARVACSCRYIGGRSLGDCRKDFEDGMELIRLSEDPEAKSVTATFPLVSSQTATYRKGYGCVLEEWEN
ncbi:hypothetical protein GRI68_12175 [Altererythrobacter halimionae]|uniref:Uncharacterized protein n=1 Tax=Alteriqipengyuania halimionae TaxID=1926630 RepID=A0A6I4U9K8_9SPHN|nr:hypothetical protein [Alteriqipengyuania halimionae]